MTNKKTQKGGVGFSFDLSKKVGGLPPRTRYSECPKSGSSKGASLYGQAGGKRGKRGKGKKKCMKKKKMTHKKKRTVKTKKTKKH